MHWLSNLPSGSLLLNVFEERQLKMHDDAVTKPERTEGRQESRSQVTDRSQSIIPSARSNPASYIETPVLGSARSFRFSSATVQNKERDRCRRRFVWACVAAFLASWFLAFLRFFFPRVLFEPATIFKIGYPSDYSLGIDEKWLQKYRIWVDRTPDRLFVIYARCTHLGCTPDWKAAENKFKCPCHGSGYDSEGINFEGPAPRPRTTRNRTHRKGCSR